MSGALCDFLVKPKQSLFPGKKREQDSLVAVMFGCTLTFFSFCLPTRCVTADGNDKMIMLIKQAGALKNKDDLGIEPQPNKVEVFFDLILLHCGHQVLFFTLFALANH
jgi:hypothetical protein